MKKLVKARLERIMSSHYTHGYPFEKQRWFHQEELDDGTIANGDCWRTCMAGVMGVMRDSVPQFVDIVDAETRDKTIRDWMHLRGFHHISINLGFQGDLSDALRWGRHISDGMLYMLAGKSGRGTNHIVICYLDNVIWDPAKGMSAGQEHEALVGPMTNSDDGTPYGWVLEMIVRSARK